MNLNQYIRGQRKGKEINRLEKEAMRDAFLADAMSGYDKITDNHERRIASLRNRILLKTKQKNRALPYWSMAAGILLLLGIGGLFFFQNPDFYTKNQGIALEEEIQFEIPITDEKKINDSQAQPVRKKLIAQTCVVKKEDVSDTMELLELAENQEITSESIVESIDFPSDTNDTMLMAMQENDKKLEEVVVVGYGKTKKSTTGSVATIEVPKKYKDFKEYVKEEMIAPSDENGKKIKGRVKLSFSTDENGRAYGIVVVKSLAPAADVEAVRLVGGFLEWGKGVEGKEIEVKFK
ncbi:MAG: hypothetical protein LBS25_08700 [Candidatus Symbiothrix sp.]|jgi:hypothetical protein|nr:hypothetical protein [Candidatus Symbiothrix sp.]